MATSPSQTVWVRVPLPTPPPHEQRRHCPHPPPSAQPAALSPAPTPPLPQPPAPPPPVTPTTPQPKPGGDWPQTKNSSTTINRHTTDANTALITTAPTTPPPPADRCHTTCRLQHPRHHHHVRPAYVTPPITRDNTLTIDTTCNATYAPYVTLAMLTNHHPHHQCPQHQRQQHHQRPQQRPQ